MSEQESVLQDIRSNTQETVGRLEELRNQDKSAWSREMGEILAHAMIMTSSPDNRSKVEAVDLAEAIRPMLDEVRNSDEKTKSDFADGLLHSLDLAGMVS